nr:hypothetical protein [Arthrobacter sp. fls2-241-R2A-172]
MRFFRADLGGRLRTAMRQRPADALGVRTEVGAGRVPHVIPSGAQEGSAVVEFIFLALLLMVPVFYFVVTVGQLQGGSFAVVGAADQAAKVYVAQSNPAGAQRAAEQTVLVALKDYGYTPEQASFEVSCDRPDCSSAGATVSVVVHLDVPLPMMPFADAGQLTASRVSATATQVVGRYR